MGILGEAGRKLGARVGSLETRRPYAVSDVLSNKYRFIFTWNVSYIVGIKVKH